MARYVCDQTVLTMRRLSTADVKSTREIARIVGFSSATVSYWLRNKHLPSETARIAPTPNRKVQKARRGHVKRLALATMRSNGYTCAKFGSANEIRVELARKHGIKVSKQTVLADLRASGLVSRVRPRVPSTCAVNWAKRLSWCRRHRTLCAADVVFSDEKFFVATGCGGHRKQWIAKSRKEMLLPIEKAGYSDKVMVWGAIGVGYRHLVVVKATGPSHQGVYHWTAAGKKKFVRRDDGATFNMTSEWYRRHCLSGCLVKHLQAANKVFMQDGAGPHKAKATMEYLRRQKIEVLEWPPRSPDLNPIEKLWAILARRVSHHYCRTIDDVVEAVKTEFAAVEQSTLDRLVRGHDKRRREVVTLKGGW